MVNHIVLHQVVMTIYPDAGIPATVYTVVAHHIMMSKSGIGLDFPFHIVHQDTHRPVYARPSLGTFKANAFQVIAGYFYAHCFEGRNAPSENIREQVTRNTAVGGGTVEPDAAAMDLTELVLRNRDVVYMPAAANPGLFIVFKL